MNPRRGLALLWLAAVALPGNTQQILTRQSIDGGGGTLQGTRYAVTAGIGQHDASASMAGGRYRMAGGFFTDLREGIFRDGFERRD